MNVALIGATGKIGSRILAELVSRGHAITAISRNPEGTPRANGVTAKMGDATNAAALAPLLKGHDAVIASTPFPGLSDHIIDAAKQSGVKRFLMVGGASSLEVAPGRMFKDTVTVPDPVRAIFEAGYAALKRLRGERDLEWTYFSPAAEIGPGERTGKFRLGGDQLVTDADGKSRISYEDYAIALVDEVEQGRHIRKRFTIAY